MTYFETLNQLSQEIGRFFKRGYSLTVISDIDKFNVCSDDVDVVNLIKLNKSIFYVKLDMRGRISKERPQPIDHRSVTAIADSVERASRNAIELIMGVVKHSVDSRSGEYEHFCNLDILKDKCFFTPYGLYWGDWETDDGFLCSRLRMSRGDRFNPGDRDEWAKFKAISNEYLLRGNKRSKNLRQFEDFGSIPHLSEDIKEAF